MANEQVSSLEEQIEQDFLTAFKAKNDEILVSILRLLKTAIKNAEIAKKDKLTNEEILKVISSEVKKHKDSIEAYQQGGRADLLEQEQKELVILDQYLPEQLSDDKVKELVIKAIRAVNPAGPQDFGRVMGKVMAEAKGQVQGDKVKKIVQEQLSQL